MNPEITDFRVRDIDEALALWHGMEGIGLSESDSPEALRGFLRRNPGLSYVARRGRALVGAVLCGHDGRRGYVHHLAVHPDERRSGLGTQLLQRSLARLRVAGIARCHAFVLQNNPYAELFWRVSGWRRRDDLLMYSLDL